VMSTLNLSKMPKRSSSKTLRKRRRRSRRERSKKPSRKATSTPNCHL
jgi:hypothetical protein